MTSDNESLLDDISPLWELLTPPLITAPTASVVSRRFNVHAVVPAALHNKWNLDFFRASDNKFIKRYSGGWGALFIEFVVPDELPLGENIYFKIQYQTTLYSHWATSRTFKIDQAPLQITHPVQNGTLDFGASFYGINGYIGPGSRVSLQQAGGHEWAYAIPGADGRWTSSPLPAALGAGSHELYVRIDKGNEHSAYIGRKFSIRPLAPRISHPVQGGILESGSSLSGTQGYSGAGSIVSLQEFGGREWASAAPGTNGTWTSTPLPRTFVGRKVLYARVNVGGHSSDSVARTFTVKPPLPSIDGPLVPTSQRPTFTGTGYEGATVEIVQQNHATPVLATATVRNGVWNAVLGTGSQDLPPGPYVLSARQRFDGVWSNWLNPPFQISVQPPRPSISVLTNPGGARQPLTITGVFNGSVTLELFHEAGGKVAGTFSSAGVTRLFTPTADWAPGTNSVRVTQTVNGVASERSEVRAFAVKPPRPAITQPASPAPPKQALTITGVLSGTVTLEMINETGGRIAGTFSSAGVTRTFTPVADWAPGTNRVRVIQTVNGVASEPSEVRAFAVKPPRPTITQPTSPAPPKQALTITGVFSGTVTLEVINETGGRVAGSYGPAGVTRIFTPAADWAPGTNRVRVIQTVNGVSSDTSDTRTFTVKPSKPAITQPTSPAAPNQVLGITGVVTGIVSGSVVLQMLDDHGRYLAGTFSGSGTTRTFTPTAHWAPGTHKVKVTQSANAVVSEPSDVRTFTVKPSKPAITQPPSPAAPKEVLTITGVASGTVTLQMLNEAGNTVAGTFSTTGIARTFTPTAEWARGMQKIQVKQSVGGVASDPSDWCIFSTQPLKLTIVPPVRVAEPKQPLTVVGVHEKATALQMRYDVSNTLIPGRFSGAGGERLFTPERNWQPVSNTVIAVQVVNGVTSEPSDPCSFEAKAPKPVIVAPTDALWPDQPLTIIDVYPHSPSVQLDMYNEANYRVKGVFSHEGAERTFTPTAGWTPGHHKLRVIQSVGGVVSDPSDWCEFTTQPFRLRLLPVIGVAEPRQSLSIVDVAEGASEVQMRDDTSNDLIPGGFSGTGGERRFTPDQDWSPLSNSVIALQMVNGVALPPSEPCVFAAKAAKPAISKPAEALLPNQLLTITGVYPGSLSVQLELQTKANIRVPGTFSPEGATRTFTPSLGWVPGSHTVKVLQSIGNVVSDPSDLCLFSVMAFNPAIINPVHSLTPDEALTITGVYDGDATALQMFDEQGRKVDGTFSAAGTTRTFAPSTHWTPGIQSVLVIQTVNGVVCNPSDLCTFRVKPGRLAISSPADPATPMQVLRLTGVYSGSAALSLQLHNDKNQAVDGVFASDGELYHFTPAIGWAAGSHTVKATQTVGSVPSDPSEPCTFFVVVEEQPEAPYFELPQAGTRTSTRPVIRVRGLPGATITVRLKDAQVLHSASADGEGLLVFSPQTSLDPGTQTLEASQQGSGPVSSWSDPHEFFVKTPPKKPQIDAPTEGSRVTPAFTLRGKGETRGEIEIRHDNLPDNRIISINGLSNWRWTASPPWDAGKYRVQVRQVDDGDSSEWSDPRAFEVVESRFLIGTTGAVVAQPLVSNHESVLLRMQVVDAATLAGVEGLEVDWRVLGNQGVEGKSISGPEGWVEHRFTPDAPGEYQVLAGLIGDDEEAEHCAVFDVTALEKNLWAPAVELYLEGEKVDLALGDLQLQRGRTYELMLKVNPGSSLLGTDITLEDQADARNCGLQCEPPLGTAQRVEGAEVRWTISSTFGDDSIFGLKLTHLLLPDWLLPGRLLANDLADDVRVELDRYTVAFGASAFMCHGTKHTLTLKPTFGSQLIGKAVSLNWLGDAAADLGMVVVPDPATPQEMHATEGVSWTFDTLDSRRDGTFAVQLNVQGSGVYSMPLIISLAHNWTRVIDIDGPWEQRPAGSFRYGVRLVSFHTTQPVEGRPVKIEISAREPQVGVTDAEGWLYVTYAAGESAVLTPISPYREMNQGS